jgi:hypothetical protein
MKRGGFGWNNLEIEAIARDADREGRHEDAAKIRQETRSYRHVRAQKRNQRTGKITKYKEPSSVQQGMRRDRRLALLRADQRTPAR